MQQYFDYSFGILEISTLLIFFILANHEKSADFIAILKLNGH